MHATTLGMSRAIMNFKTNVTNIVCHSMTLDLREFSPTLRVCAILCSTSGHFRAIDAHDP